MAKKSPFDFWKSIQKKEYQEDITGYSEYIMKLLLSSDKDYCKVANILNKIGQHRLPDRAFYDFYYYLIPQNNKYLKYPKKLSEIKMIEYLQEYFLINENLAKKYYELLEEEELTEIKNYFERKDKV